MKDNILVLEAKQTNYEELRDIFFTVRRDTFHWIDPKELKLSDFNESTKDELILAAFIKNKIVGFVSIWVPDKFIIIYLYYKTFKVKVLEQFLLMKPLKR